MRPIAIFWIYASLSLFLVFYIPTLVPVKLNSSESYFFGYNNRAGFFLFVPLMAVASLWWRSFRITSLSESPSIAVSVWQLWKAWAIGLTACGFMYWLTARYGGYRDSSYLIDRIELASRGLFPYRDFEFSYGAALIYLPLWISRIFRLSIPNAYYLFWLLSVLAGIWMLRQVINRIDCPSREKGNVFVLLYLAILPGILSTGTNYTGVRFLSGPLFALIVYDAIRNRSVKSQIVGSLQAIAFCAALLLVSPESAIAFCAGISAFFFFFYFRSGQRFWLFPYCFMVSIFSLLVGAADRLGVFFSLRAFASGGFTLPLVPALHILVLFVSVFFAACYLAEAVATRNFQSNSLPLLLVTLPGLAAAMGRCDPDHVIFNAIGIFVLCMLRISNSAAIWKWYRFAFVLTFLVLDLVGGQLLYVRPIEDAFSYVLGTPSKPDATKDAVVLPRGLQGVGLAPFGYSATHNPTGVDQGYYSGVWSAVTPDSIDTKISELARRPSNELVLPDRYDGWCHMVPEAGYLGMRVLFVYPFRSKVVHRESIYTPLCDYIQKNYYQKDPPGPGTYGYSIWVRK